MPNLQNNESNQMHENTDRQVLDMFHGLFSNLGTSLCFILTEAFLLLVSNTGAIKRMRGKTAKELQNLFPQNVYLYFYDARILN